MLRSTTCTKTTTSTSNRIEKDGRCFSPVAPPVGSADGRRHLRSKRKRCGHTAATWGWPFKLIDAIY